MLRLKHYSQIRIYIHTIYIYSSIFIYLYIGNFNFNKDIKILSNAKILQATRKTRKKKIRKKDKKKEKKKKDNTFYIRVKFKFNLIHLGNWRKTIAASSVTELSCDAFSFASSSFPIQLVFA